MTVAVVLLVHVSRTVYIFRYNHWVLHHGECRSLYFHIILCHSAEMQEQSTARTRIFRFHAQRCVYGGGGVDGGDHGADERGGRGGGGSSIVIVGVVVGGVLVVVLMMFIISTLYMLIDPNARTSG